MTTALANYDDACRAIALCFTKDEAKEIKDKAIALAVYAKQMNNKEAQIQWVSVATRAERRWGHIYAESEKAKGGDRGGKQPLDGSRKEPANKSPTLAEMGVSKKASARAQPKGRAMAGSISPCYMMPRYQTEQFGDCRRNSCAPHKYISMSSSNT
jgi:hypothetical protein